MVGSQSLHSENMLEMVQWWKWDIHNHLEINYKRILLLISSSCTMKNLGKEFY